MNKSTVIRSLVVSVFALVAVVPALAAFASQPSTRPVPAVETVSETKTVKPVVAVASTTKEIQLDEVVIAAPRPATRSTVRAVASKKWICTDRETLAGFNARSTNAVNVRSCGWE